MQVYLIRHPRPLGMDGRCYGQLDIETEAPTQAAQRLRGHLVGDVAVLASPLQRTRTLAEALHAAPAFDARLMEMNFGAWEGRLWDDIPRREIDAWAADVYDFAPPGGESLRQMQARALDCVRALAAPRVALVTHGGIMRALLGAWLHWPLEKWSRQHFDFAGISLIETTPHGKAATLHYLNR